MITRRGTLQLLLSGAFAALYPAAARAAVARALTLEDLVHGSDAVALAVPEAAHCHWEVVGTRSRIVTLSELRVDEAYRGGHGLEARVVVRTLGGRVGDVGQIVHGEPLLSLRQPALVFLRRRPDGLRYVVGRAQGAYQARPDAAGVRRLRPNPGQCELTGFSADSAVARLSGLDLSEARRAIRGVAGR